MPRNTGSVPPRVSPARILIVVNAAWFFISHRLPLAIAARDAGYDVHVAAGEATLDEIAMLERHGLAFHRLVLRRASRSPLENASLVAQLVRLYRRVRPDLVHHVTVKPVLFGTLAARLTRVPAVVNAVSGLGYVFIGDGLVRRALRAIVSLAYRVTLRHPRMITIFQNDDDRREFCAIARLFAGDTVLQPGSGVDLSRFAVSPEPPTPPVSVLLPARMLRDKGVVEFAQAVGMLQREGLKVEGILAGPLDPANPAGLSLGEIRALERACGVQWVGNVTDMVRMLASVHIVCLPSYREGLPKALAEAAAVGRALVTTDVPGCRAVVEDGVNGILVLPREVEPLARALERLALNPDLRLTFARASRHRAETVFDVRAVVAQTLGIYAGLLGGRRESESRGFRS